MSTQRSAGLPRLAVRRPITMVMVYAALLMLGVIAYSRLPVDLMPSGFSPPFLGVWVPYPNATPGEVEQTIARPVEGMLGTISGVRQLSSTSSSDGAWVFLRFYQSTDMDVAYADVRDRMDRVMPELPAEIERTFVRKFADDDQPILWAGLEIERQLEDPYTLLDETVVRELLRIDGVANVELFGVPQRSIQVMLDQERVRAHGIDLAALATRLSSDNFSLSSGFVIESDRKMFVRSMGKYRTAADVAAIQVNDLGVRLDDIARVSYEEPERRQISRIGGRRGAMLSVMKESAANTAEVGARVSARADEIFATNPALQGITLQPLFNQAELINESISQLQDSMTWGAAFAVLVLLLFLRRFRMTLAVTLAMPFSLLMAVIVLYFVGWSLNVVTMMGIMICVGLVVDNSIVVIENIYRRAQQGDSPTDAAEIGASQVVLAITIATLTTVVVIVPLVIMNDDVGLSFYMLRLGTPLVVGVLASLVVALTLIPMLTVRLASSREVSEPKVVTRIVAWYARATDWVLAHRLDASVAALAIIVSVAIPAGQVAQSDSANGNIGNIEVNLEMPRNLTIEDTELLIARMETEVYTQAEAWRIRTVTTRFGVGGGSLEIFLQDPPREAWWQYAGRQFGVRYLGMDRGAPRRDDVILELPDVLPELPGVEYEIREAGDNESSSRLVRLMIYGDDSESLTAFATQLSGALEGRPGILTVNSALERGQDELHVRIDRELAEQAGVTPRAAAQLISFSLRGIELPELRLGDQEINVRFQLAEEDRQTLQQLRDMPVVTNRGTEVPLGAIANFEVNRSPGQISRTDGKTSMTIRVLTTEEDVDTVYASIDDVMAETPLPPGISWDKGDRFARLQETGQAQAMGMILVVTLVFILMAILFESLILPFSVILTLPFAIVGLFWALFITGTANDVFTGIGMLVLVGIVVNNAIVLVDLANQLRSEGVERNKALRMAVERRLRPIAMTAMTTIFGLVPMSVGNVDMIGISYAGMGRGMAGGLLLHSIITPLAVPLLYTLLDDLRAFGARLVARVAGRLAGRRVLPETAA
ncbi:MAG: MMPL family transporter [Acidobacteria bacterium]|nr:MMPL family transporter [Acidobacteriota bacterium]